MLIIEEVSMMGAAIYNMLDLRSAHGRSSAHDVSETTYHRPNHHFGRIPIVIHLGDFLQLSPTANIGLIADVNETLDDGSYKFKDTIVYPRVFRFSVPMRSRVLTSGIHIS